MLRTIVAIKRVVYDAFGHFNDDDGWAMASHLAISSLMALFPFLIFVTTLAGFIGADSLSGAVVDLIFETWPDQIAAPIALEVHNVLTVPRTGFLAVSLIATAFFASNGVEALRTSLNRAYRVGEPRSLWFRRIQSLVFVLIATATFLAVSYLLVWVPLIGDFADKHLPWLVPYVAGGAVWRVTVASFLIIVALIVVHFWLPAGKRRFRHVIPGICITLFAWMVGSYLFALYLESFSTYATTYAGLASMMIAVVFLYILSAIFILGGEFNAAIRRYRDARAKTRG
ncbi:MAG: YihY/virulence factor BrkB family protein [Rhizobiaceae bacterium]